MRVILDANVVIAAVASRGLCEAILELCLEHHHLILCEGILEEIAEKLRIRIKVSPPVIAEYLRVLRNNAQILEPEEVEKAICRDPDDLMILGLVAPGDADAIITGDKDLLVIKEYKKARIMTPRNFWESNKEEK
ncbi:MAG: putative toxin-antitoxin system toxin component, PIN family [Lentisphaerae bacterium RIFOXYB12_FULL_60_10]|nr:MAG: putative toxin-antitoxin system toxin component, PIN family [Lentisphaerae bacterium RIFOXYA12_FULL_60_10]OGV78471.1 MAG: putative toxin-antitoxin system toxin component, PIN family [Lentisphaerae bacterium RIFOXYB12_FULL_60_10]